MSLPKISHTVFFWLKNPDSIEDRSKLVEGLKTLGQIEQVKAIHIGVPASTEQREVVVNSYQVSELLMFENVEDEKIYQSHPIHQAFVENCSHLWQKVEVYDSVAV
ncbi:Dabb family protein (plasmid) [Catenovulum sp. SX2]|uniref:Dabb family protein n=1 Tax=Catenovulum sp. SX2 TaxID=3398614 RepID=UPI003F874040